MQELSQAQHVLLELLSKALFQKEVNSFCSDWKAVFREANVQKVLPLVYTASKDCNIDAQLAGKAAKITKHNIAESANVYFAHFDLGVLLEQNAIPYVMMKGIASAAYYPKPELRVFGDVDCFVPYEAFQEACEVLLANGFAFFKEGVKDTAFEKDGVLFEMHHGVRGTPKNDAGELLFQTLFSDLSETAKDYSDGKRSVKVTDDYHHGLILLLHTLAHLTGPGIGLRHLCDWAVFESSFENEAFKALFEKPLKEYGLWRFAQIFSLCATQYLGASYRDWQGEASEQLLNGLICDIMAAGDFGGKDSNRHRQIKYISDSDDVTVNKGSSLAQAKKALEKKAAVENKSKAAVVVEYIKNVLAGKRKPDSKKTLEDAAQRKALYSEFHLFEKEPF